MLKQARAERLRTLFKEGVQSKDSLDDAENQLSVAEAELKKAIGAIDFAKFEVSQTVITSPINGVVLQKYRELGDTINFGGEIQAGGGATDIAQLADLSDLRCEVDINESDIAKVKMGTPATVILDAYPDDPFPATVVKIYPEADRQKGTVKVEVRVLQPDLKVIKPEMSAKVTFQSITTQTAAAPMVLVPKKAIVTEGSANSVWVVRGDSSASGAYHRGTRVSGRRRGQTGTQRRRDGDRRAGGDDQGRTGSHASRVVAGEKENHFIECETRGGFHASFGRDDACT